MWKKSELLPNKEYRVGLCQVDRDRFFVLLEANAIEGEHCVFVTDLVPRKLLESRDYIGISREVPLRGGDPFVVDAHGTWFTMSEYQAMRRHEDHASIQWVTGVAPRRVPK